MPNSFKTEQLALAPKWCHPATSSHGQGHENHPLWGPSAMGGNTEAPVLFCRWRQKSLSAANRGWVLFFLSLIQCMGITVVLYHPREELCRGNHWNFLSFLWEWEEKPYRFQRHALSQPTLPLPPVVFPVIKNLFCHACILICFSCVWLFVTPWTRTHQAPLSMGVPRQESWSGLPGCPPGELADPGSNSCLLCLLHWQAPPFCHGSCLIS